MRTLHRFFFIGLALFPLLGSGPITKTAQATVPAAEKNALVDLYNATDGAHWTHNDGWKNYSSTDPCDSPWYGVTCTSANDHVIKIELRSNNLTGTIPVSIGNLTQLQYLDLYENNLTGNIPSSIGNLTDLQYIQFYHNNFTGVIPESLGSLKQLQHLDLSSNNLSGPIPAYFKNLLQLQDIRLSRNYLIGPIPSFMGNLTQLETIHLRTNHLCGRIPATLTNLIHLLDNSGLNLDHNRLITRVGSTLAAFIDQKSSAFGDWSTTQDSQSCFSWPMFLPAITAHY